MHRMLAIVMPIGVSERLHGHVGRVRAQGHVSVCMGWDGTSRRQIACMHPHMRTRASRSKRQQQPCNEPRHRSCSMLRCAALYY